MSLQQRKQQSQDKRRKNTIYGTANSGNIIGGLHGVKTRYLFIYGARKETSGDAIKTFLIENDITVFNADVVSNELATYKSFKVTIPADQKGAACLPSIWSVGIHVRDFIYPVKQTCTNNGVHTIAEVLMSVKFLQSTSYKMIVMFC